MLLTTKEPEQRSGTIDEKHAILGLFADAISFPDYSLIAMQKVTFGDYQYKTLDFLYFSAITITTVGFGDIVPNSQYIRVLVMVETRCGTGTRARRTRSSTPGLARMPRHR
jgi:Ion channel